MQLSSFFAFDHDPSKSRTCRISKSGISVFTDCKVLIYHRTLKISAPAKTHNVYMGLGSVRYLECSLPKDNAHIESPEPRKMASKKETFHSHMR